MTKFETLYALAVRNCGGEAALLEKLPQAKPTEELAEIGDDRYLSEIARRIFHAGFVWKIIDNKWEGFEAAFAGFNPLAVANFSDERLEELASDVRIVRNLQKITSVRDNALFVLDKQRSHGSFARYIAEWPVDDIVGLWLDMKRQGARLGGNSAAMVLRRVGKDTFILSDDVCAALVNHKLIDNLNVTSKKGLYEIQTAFLDMQKQCGRPLCEISRILSCTV